MGNGNTCSCLKQTGFEDDQFEYVIPKIERDKIIESKSKSVHYTKFEMNSDDLNQAYFECSFTRHTDEPNSKSIGALNSEADQLSFIAYNPGKDI